MFEEYFLNATAKLGFVGFLLGYLILAVVVVRQVQLLIRVLNTSLADILVFFSYIHLFLAFLALVVILLVL